MPDRMPEDLPDRMPEDMPEDMPDHMPEDMPDRMSNRMSEDMSDRMPEDLPVRKCINVMVGITRSKVFFFILEYPLVRFCWLLQILSQPAKFLAAQSQWPDARARVMWSSALSFFGFCENWYHGYPKIHRIPLLHHHCSLKLPYIKWVFPIFRHFWNVFLERKSAEGKNIKTLDGRTFSLAHHAISIRAWNICIR